MYHLSYQTGSMLNQAMTATTANSDMNAEGHTGGYSMTEITENFFS